MNVRKVVAGSVLAAGLGVAGVFGASPAQALGAAYDDEQGNSWSVGSGATANVGGNASDSRAIAISVFAPATADVGGNASGSTAVAVGGFNPASSVISGNAVDAGAYTVGGSVRIEDDADGTQVFNGGSDVVANGQAGSTTTLAVCGTSFTGQAAHVNVSAGTCG